MKKFERIVGLTGSFASILGVSAASVFAIIKSLQGQAFEIGIKMSLSGAAVLVVLMLLGFISIVLNQLSSILFSSDTYKGKDRSDITFLSNISNIYIYINITVFLISYTGLLIIIWSYDFQGYN